MDEVEKTLKCVLCPIEDFKKYHAALFERMFQQHDSFYAPNGLAVTAMEFFAESHADNPKVEAAAQNIMEQSRRLAKTFEKYERLYSILSQPETCEQFCDGTKVDTTTKYIERRCNTELIDPELRGLIAMPLTNDGD